MAAGNTKVDVDADHIVALWNGGNLRADIAVGKFGAAELASVLPYPNKVAVIYMSGAQLLEALEAASQALPYGDASADACASFMQAAGLTYSVNADRRMIREKPTASTGSRQFRQPCDDHRCERSGLRPERHLCGHHPQRKL